MRIDWRRSIADPHYAGYRLWHNVLTVFVFISCLSLALESVPGYDERFGRLFAVSEWSAVAVFTADAAANIALAPSPWRYLVSFWGLIDLISIAPSYLMLFNLTALRGTKVIRLLRLARMLRVLKLARAARDQAGEMAAHEVNPIAANLRIYFIIFFSVLMISSSAMYFIEGHLYAPEVIAAGQQAIDAATPAGQTPAVYMPADPLSGNPIGEDQRFFTSIPAAMWWCMVTMTTTGYGDMYPVTVGGRIVAAFTMLFGLVLFAILLNVINKTMMILFFGDKLPD